MTTSTDRPPASARGHAQVVIPQLRPVACSASGRPPPCPWACSPGWSLRGSPARLPGPAPLARALIICLTAGLVWQFVLVLVLVRREQGTLRWPVLREALWLRAPRSPRPAGAAGGCGWSLLPLIVAFAAEQFVPKLPHPPAATSALPRQRTPAPAFLPATGTGSPCSS